MNSASDTSAQGIRFRPFLEEDARAVVEWKYPGPYSVYDLDPNDPAKLAALLRPEYRYYAAVTEKGGLIGYFCAGEDARVPGWLYDDVVLDIGAGMRPDLTGKGNGLTYLNLVLAFAEKQWAASAFRATIAAWNHRAILVCNHAGFLQVARFTATNPANGEYVVMVRRRQ